MIELLPIFLGVLCGLTLRRLAFGDADHTWSWRTVQLCSSGTYRRAGYYRLGDSLRQLCGGSSDCFWRRPFPALTQSEVTHQFITRKGSLKRIHWK
jgi:hypothetical protein